MKTAMGNPNKTLAQDVITMDVVVIAVTDAASHSVTIQCES